MALVNASIDGIASSGGPDPTLLLVLGILAAVIPLGITASVCVTILRGGAEALPTLPALPAPASTTANTHSTPMLAENDRL